MKNDTNSQSDINIGKQIDNTNNKGQTNVASSGATINANQTIIQQQKEFNPHKKIMLTNLSMLSDNFIGREKYINEIDSLLTNQDVIVLSGSGGIGKTQIDL